MKRYRYFVVPALVTVSLAVATASVKMPRDQTPGGPIPGEIGPGGCPIASVDGKIEEIDLDRQAFLLRVKGQEDVFSVLIGDDTKFRVPGVKKKDLKTGGLSKVPANASVKLKFCVDTGDVTEVKVRKKKKKKSTT